MNAGESAVCHGVERRGGCCAAEGRRENAGRLDRDHVVGSVERGVELRGGVDGKEVSEETSGMGRCHRGSRESRGGGLAALESRQNVETRGEDVDARTVVREIRALVTESRCSNSHSKLRGRGGVVARVTVIVSCTIISIWYFMYDRRRYTPRQRQSANRT